jgi:Doubled CXXCH motif (Paired_CXXCH_1)
MDRHHSRHMLMALAGVVAVALLSAGCTTSSQAPSTTTTTTVPAPSATTTKAPDISGIVTDWVGSKHSDVVTVDEVFCKQCHDGAVYASNPKPAPAFPVATDCRVCHTGKGQAIRMAGQVSLSATSAPVTGGQGAVCMSCHTNIAAPKPNDPKRGAPHNNPAADVLLAFGGIRSVGATYGSTVKHATQPDSCVTCHMQKDSHGVPTHTFKVQGVVVCNNNNCHPGISGPDVLAKADFDGNGTVQGLQEEVQGLDKKLRAALAAQTKGGSVEDFRGNIVFVSKTTTMTGSAFSDKVYNAGYNVILVEKDKSWGIHNPQFVVNLLQQSYKDLTGKEIPGAAPFN